MPSNYTPCYSSNKFWQILFLRRSTCYHPPSSKLVKTAKIIMNCVVDRKFFNFGKKLKLKHSDITSECLTFRSRAQKKSQAGRRPRDRKEKGVGVSGISQSFQSTSFSLIKFFLCYLAITRRILVFGASGRQKNTLLLDGCHHSPCKLIRKQESPKMQIWTLFSYILL